jgi:hypothetical protein
MLNMHLEMALKRSAASNFRQKKWPELPQTKKSPHIMWKASLPYWQQRLLPSKWLENQNNS